MGGARDGAVTCLCWNQHSLSTCWCLLGTKPCSQVLGVGQWSQQAEPSAGGAGIFPFGLLFSRQVVSDSVTPWTEHARLPLSFTASRSLLKLMSFESVMPSSHLILHHPFSSFPQSFSASRSFPMSQLFASGGQNIGASASASVLPKNIQDWSPLGWTGWISLQSKGLSRIFSSTTVQKHQFFGAQPSLWFSSHIRTRLLEKPLLWLDGPLLAKWCLCCLLCCLGWPQRGRRSRLGWNLRICSEGAVLCSVAVSKALSPQGPGGDRRRRPSVRIWFVPGTSPRCLRFLALTSRNQVHVPWSCQREAGLILYAS